MRKILNNRTFILVLAFVGGIGCNEIAVYLEPFIMPALALVLIASTTQVSIRDFLPIKVTLRFVLQALLLNYLLLGSTILLLSWWLMPTRDLWIGYVLVAAAPPGIAIVPFTYILNGNFQVSLLGTFGAYLFSLILTPFLIFVFTGETAVSPLSVFSSMLFLIFIPFLLSQILNSIPFSIPINKWRGTIINWGFFVVIFTVVGVNQDVFLKAHHILLPVSLVAIMSSFALAFLVDFWSRRFHIQDADRKSYILLATIKTSAFAAAVGLNLYNEAASIPGAVISAWYALYFIVLGAKK